MSQSQSPTEPGQSDQPGPNQQYSPQQETEYPQWQTPSQPLYPPQFPPQQQWQRPPVQPFMPQQPPKKRRVGRALGIGCSSVVALIVLIVIIAAAVSHGGATPSSNRNTQSTPVSQPTSQPTVQPKPTQPTVQSKPTKSFLTFSDGIFQVGKDIKAGTYRTRVGSPGCYYARLSSIDTSAIISNDNTDNPAVITIAPSDAAFQSQGCGTWTSDLSQITASKTSFGDGMYIVGTDVEPGIYKTSGSPGCYYARLSAFDTNAIIENNLPNSVALVTITASDKSFYSVRCGSWTRQ